MKTLVACISTIAVLILSTCSNSLNAQVWNREVADSSGNKLGMYCKIALDPSGDPMIAHFDGDFLDLVLLEKENNQWNRVVIDTSGYTGWSAGLAIDADGDPHLCFENGALIYEPASTFGVNYLSREQDDWTKESIESYQILLPLSSTHIALTSAGDPVIGYYNIVEELYYLAFKRGGEWVKKQSPYPYTAVNMLLKSDGTPVILLNAGSSLILATYNENTDTWEDFTLPGQPYVASAFREDMDFVLDQNDHVHLVGKFMDVTMSPFIFVKYLHFDWENWESETITPTDIEHNNQLALDQDDNPVILAIHYTLNHLVLYSYNEASWEYETVDENCDDFECADMVFDQDNLPHIVLAGEPEDIHSPRESMVVYYHFLPGLPDLTWKPEFLHFGKIWTESYRILPLTISNNGEAPLIIGGYQLSNTDILSIESSTFPVYIAAGDSLTLQVKFSPSEEQSYSENLQLTTNDPGFPELNIPITGTGAEAGLSSTLELHVKDVYVDLTYMVITEDDPLEAAEVGLYRGGSLVTTEQYTDIAGSAVFTGLEEGSYILVLSKEADPADEDIDCAVEKTITLGPGYNTIGMVLADSLFHYQAWLSNELATIEETGNDLAPILGYQEVMAEVNEWMHQEASDYNTMHTESMARMILVEHMVYDLFGDGYDLGNEMFKDFGELIAFVFYSNDWATRLLDILFSLVQAAFGEGGAGEVLQEIWDILINEIIKDEIYNQVTEQVLMAASEVGYPASEALEFAWHQVWSAYSSGWNFSFGTEEWGSIIMSVKEMLEPPFIQEVYVDALTAPSIEKGLGYTEANWYNSNFYTAFMQEVDYVSEEKNKVGMALDAAEVFRVSAEMFMTVATIMNWVGSIPGLPYKDVIEQTAVYLEVAAYLEVIIALTTSTTKFFLIPSNMESTVDDIFFPEGKPGNSALTGHSQQQFATNRVNMMLVNQMKSNLKSSNEDYAAILQSIRDMIAAGDRMSAASEIPMLRAYEKAYHNNFLRTASPVMAVASQAKENLQDFTPMWDSLKTRHAQSGEERFLLYFQLLLATGDTTDASATEISRLIDQHLEHTNTLTTTVSNLLDTVTGNMEIPAVLSVSVTSTDKTRLAVDETGTVLITVMNTGAANAENISLILSCNDAILPVGSDSIFIGTLSPGEETGEIPLTFVCKDENFALGIWRMKLHADDASTLPCSGSFNLGSPGTSLPRRTDVNQESFTVYPNPMINQGIISYRLEADAKVKFSLLDASGRQLYVLSEKALHPGYYTFHMDLSHVKGGIYTIVLEKDGVITGARKVVHLSP